jgi:N utilization substance protein B
MKGNRRKAREDALQILYQLDVNHGLTPSNALNYFATFFSMERPVDEFTQRLVIGVAQNRAELDMVVEKISEHWRTDRMAVVDRNILRLGAFELFHCDDIPATVSINEMIEVAKLFGSENSAAFINGILDKLKGTLNRPTKAP